MKNTVYQLDNYIHIKKNQHNHNPTNPNHFLHHSITPHDVSKKHKSIMQQCCLHKTQCTMQTNQLSVFPLIPPSDLSVTKFKNITIKRVPQNVGNQTAIYSHERAFSIT